MAQVQGYRTAVKMSGTAVTLTSEATTSVSASVYQITDTAKRILDPATAVQVVDNGSPLADADVVVDYLFGKVTKASGSFTGPVTISGAYLPVYTVAECRAVSFEVGLKEMERSVFGAAYEQYAMGRQSFKADVDSFDSLVTDVDTDTGGTQSIESWFTGKTAKLLEVTLNPDTPKYLRAWVLLSTLGFEANGEELQKGKFTLIGCAQNGAGDGASERAFCGFG